jgi:hypothetical protein
MIHQENTNIYPRLFPVIKFVVVLSFLARMYIARPKPIMVKMNIIVKRKMPLIIAMIMAISTEDSMMSLKKYSILTQKMNKATAERVFMVSVDTASES